MTLTNLAAGRPNNVSSFTTSSISPAVGSILLLAVGGRADHSTSNTPTVNGLGVTWHQIAVQNDTAGTQGLKITLFYAVITSSVTGTIGVDFSSQTQTDSTYAIDQVTLGVDLSNAILQNVSGAISGASQTVTLASLRDTKSVAYGCFWAGATGTTPSGGSGFSVLSAQQALLTEYRANVTSVNYSFTGTNDSVGIAIELGTGQAGGSFIYTLL